MMTLSLYSYWEKMLRRAQKMQGSERCTCV